MAIKDWKKLRVDENGFERWITKEKLSPNTPQKQITVQTAVGKAIKQGKWETYLFNFEGSDDAIVLGRGTKSEALKLAKNYMRTH